MKLWLLLRIVCTFICDCHELLTFDPSLTLMTSLDEDTPVWTKLILRSSRSLRENL